MIKLFNIPNYVIDTSIFTNILHDKIVSEFENKICNYVGAKYACSINSATNAIFLIFLNKGIKVKIPSMIPPVVANALITSGNEIEFYDNINWVGDSYVLHDFGDYKIIDSAQKIAKNQFLQEANEDDLMFFSFYPTKPIGSCDGGMIVSNDREKIEWFREAVMNGMTYSENNWERKIKFPGYKMYLNSIQAYIANENFELLELKKKKLEKIREMYNIAFDYKNTSDHLYRLKVSNRNELISFLSDNSVVTGIHYDALHLNKVYSLNYQKLTLSEEESKKTISIPFHENLSEEEVKLVINKIKSYGKVE